LTPESAQYSTSEGDQPTHQVGDIDGVHAVARPAFETVAIQQRQE
jgi:hypothetical protein